MTDDFKLSLPERVSSAFNAWKNEVQGEAEGANLMEFAESLLTDVPENEDIARDLPDEPNFIGRWL